MFPTNCPCGSSLDGSASSRARAVGCDQTSQPTTLLVSAAAVRPAIQRGTRPSSESRCDWNPIAAPSRSLGNASKRGNVATSASSKTAAGLGSASDERSPSGIVWCGIGREERRPASSSDSATSFSPAALVTTLGEDPSDESDACGTPYAPSRARRSLAGTSRVHVHRSEESSFDASRLHRAHGLAVVSAPAETARGGGEAVDACTTPNASWISTTPQKEKAHRALPSTAWEGTKPGGTSLRRVPGSNGPEALGTSPLRRNAPRAEASPQSKRLIARSLRSLAAARLTVARSRLLMAR